MFSTNAPTKTADQQKEAGPTKRRSPKECQVSCQPQTAERGHAAKDKVKRVQKKSRHHRRRRVASQAAHSGQHKQWQWRSLRSHSTATRRHKKNMRRELEQKIEENRSQLKHRRIVLKETETKASENSRVQEVEKGDLAYHGLACEKRNVSTGSSSLTIRNSMH